MSGRAGLVFASSKGFDNMQQKQLEKDIQSKKLYEVEQAKLLELQNERRKNSSNNNNNNKEISKLDWMYGGPGLTSSNADEYLLGKQFKMIGDVETIENPLLSTSTNMNNTPLLGGNNYKNTKSVALNVNNKLREDPLFSLLQKEQDEKNKMISNPALIAKLKKQLEFNLKVEAEKLKLDKLGKYDKSDKHKHHKQESKSKKRSSSRSKSPKPRKSNKSRSPNRSDKYRDSKYEPSSKYESKSIKRSYSRSKSPSKDHKSSKKYSRSPRRRSRSPKRDSRRRSRSGSIDNYRRSRSPSNDKYKCDGDKNHSSRNYRRSRSPINYNKVKPRSKSPVKGSVKYGLINTQPKQLSAEEKLAKLRAMQSDAEQNDIFLRNKIDKDAEESKKESIQRGSSDQFVASMQRNIWENSSVEDQINRNKHYLQRK